LPSFRRTLQRKNMMAANYRHIGGDENRLGRHYSRFSGIDPRRSLPINLLLCENRQTAGRIGEDGLDARTGMLIHIRDIEHYRRSNYI
jgi:hypothetical protein